MADKHFDLIVIGGGPAGYVAAIRAAQLGLKTAIVERAKLGGVCLNWGCIPSKSLLANAELYEKCRDQAETWGLTFEKLGYDWSQIIGRSRDVASKLNKGVEFLMKKNKVEHFNGHAKIVAGKKDGQPCKVEVHDAETHEEITPSPTEVKKLRETITADHVLVATGAVARDLPFAKFDGEKIIGAREAMTLPEKPEKMVVVGGGAIGIEFAYFYHSFGTEITVVEMMPRILPVEDDDVCKFLHKTYKKKGMDLRTEHTVTAVEKTKKGVKVAIAPFKDGKADESKAETVEADKVLLAIGVTGRFDGLFDDSLGLKTEKGAIVTDYKPGPPYQNGPLTYQTSVDGIHAVGDVIGAPWLAHVASEEAIACVEHIAGHDPYPIDYSVVPGCTYCHPQVASVGYTERDLKEQGLEKDKDYAVGNFTLNAHGKAIAANVNEGLVKIIRGLPRGEILGAHLCCDQATELIGELGLARRLEATSEELIATIHAHPTMYEAVHEAALASEGRVIHG